MGRESGRSGYARVSLIAAGLFVLTLASRLPFLSQQLWAWDSVLYARALEDGFHVDYALAEQRPHPPGYILYVGVAWLARLLTQDSNAALVAVAAVASAMTAAALFLFARRFASERSAILVAIGFAASPLVWQYSEIAYPYTVLGLLSLSLAACLALSRGRGIAAAVVASAAFGAAAGFRQDLLFIVGPLWLWSVFPLRWRERGAAAAMLFLGCLFWLVPSAALSGGPASYLGAVVRQTDFVRATHSVLAQGLPALGVNITTTLYAVAWGLGLFAAPIAFVIASGAIDVVRRGRIALGPAERLIAVWTLPALALYVVLHIGEWGYVLSVLPGLYVLAAIGIDRAAALRVPARGFAFAGAVAAGLVFLATSAPFSADAIARQDRELASRVSFVRQHYQAQHILLLAREDFLLVRYYLPEYRTWLYDPEPFRRSMLRKRAPKVSAIVVFNPGLRAVSDDARKVDCAKGVQLVYLAIEPGAVVELYGEQYTIAESQR
ncbi:MAG: hypothetical protein ABJB39_10930 [Chloroflexota bacterium]